MAKIPAVHDRHHQVEDDGRRGWPSPKVLQSGVAVRGARHLETFLLQRLAEGGTDRGVVIDDQHAPHRRREHGLTGCRFGSLSGSRNRKTAMGHRGA